MIHHSEIGVDAGFGYNDTHSKRANEDFYMVQDRKEPTISSSIRPERDEIARHQSRGGNTKSRPTTPNRPGAGAASPVAKPLKPRSSASGVLGLIIGVVAVGIAGFAVWQLQQTQAALSASDDRIAELEARLNLTNSESDQSVTRILERVTKAEEQYDLLWANYRKHRDGLAEANKQLQKVVKESGGTAKSVASQQTSLNAVKALTNEQQLVLTQLSDDIAAAQTQLSDLRKVAKELEAAGKTVSGLQERIVTNEEAIAAIDAFRRSANADIQQLKQRLAAP
ncbi:hypothetical protein [Aurantivibrio plasticivorans]